MTIMRETNRDGICSNKLGKSGESSILWTWITMPYYENSKAKQKEGLIWNTSSPIDYVPLGKSPLLPELLSLDGSLSH